MVAVIHLSDKIRMLEKINVTKGIHKPKTGINDCKWQVIAVPLNKCPAVSSRSQHTVCRYLLNVNTMQPFLFRWCGLMTEGFPALKTNSFSLLASLLSALPLFGPSHSHLFTSISLRESGTRRSSQCCCAMWCHVRQSEHEDWGRLFFCDSF